MKEEKKEVQEEVQVNEFEVKYNELLEEYNKLLEEKNSLIEKIKLKEADLINYRKRKDEEVANMLKYANEDLIKELIGVVDNFERAISLDDDNLTDELSKFLSGFKIMYSTLVSILNKFGVEEINRVGQVYDPKMEEAILTGTDESQEDEVVLEVFQKGYKLKDRVIRPAKVKINQR